MCACLRACVCRDPVREDDIVSVDPVVKRSALFSNFAMTLRQAVFGSMFPFLSGFVVMFESCFIALTSEFFAADKLVPLLPSDTGKLSWLLCQALHLVALLEEENASCIDIVPVLSFATRCAIKLSM